MSMSKADSAKPLKLNLGSGQNPLEGYINVDKYGDPDIKCDLEAFPWPFEDSSVDEVTLNHVLEHLGAAPDVFINIMKELYRVCKPGALVHINVPHPRHDNFIGDPTHVRVVSAEVMSLFSKRECLRWKELHAANSPLALYHNVDFELRAASLILDPIWQQKLAQELITVQQAEEAVRERNNVAVEIRLMLEVIK